MDIDSNEGITSDIIKVVLVDDHELAYQRVRKLLDSSASIKIVGEAANYYEAISLIRELEPDVVLLDIRLEEGNGINVARLIKATIPETKILIFTTYDDDPYVRVMTGIGII